MPEPRIDSSTATRPPLISAQPWSCGDAPAGLIDRALVAAGTIGGNRVRVLPEPLPKDLDGVEVQAVRVLFDDADTASQTLNLRVDAEGNDCVVGRAGAPDDTSMSVHVVHHSRFEFGYPRPNRTPRATACPRLPQESVTK